MNTNGHSTKRTALSWLNQKTLAALLVVTAVCFTIVMMLLALNAPLTVMQDTHGAALITTSTLPGISDGTVPALTVFLLIIGIVFYFPSLINSTQRDSGVDSSQFSSMRLAVLMVVCCFVLINIKNGWSHGLTRDQLEPWWIILAVAMGSKALQYFAEVKKAGLSVGPDPLINTSARSSAAQNDSSSDNKHETFSAVNGSASRQVVTSSTEQVEHLGAGRVRQSFGSSDEMLRLQQQHQRAVKDKKIVVT